MSLGRHWFALAIASSEPQIEAVDPFAQTEVGSRETSAFWTDTSFVEKEDTFDLVVASL